VGVGFHTDAFVADMEIGDHPKAGGWEAGRVLY
jgi:hypothetical protein